MLAPLLAILTSTFGQNVPPIVTGGPASLTQLLKQHHVDVTKVSLLNALKNSDPEVRSLAAEKLAEDKEQDAIESVQAALRVENVPGSRINIALALAQLGDEDGIVALKTACDDANLAGYLRARAITYLLDLHRDDCLNGVLEMLKPESDSDSRLQALSLLPRFRNVTKEESQRIIDLTVKALGDQTPAVRMDASSALAALGDASVIPYLERAVASEQDEVVHSQMQANIRALQQKKPRP
jgi:HEAT repeat protein